MSLQVVWNSPMTTRDAGDVSGERARLLRVRMRRNARNQLPVRLGERVLYMDEPGCVVALNISGMGRWPAHLYPFVILLDCGLVVRAHAMDLEVETPHNRTTGAGKSESTVWF